MMKMDVAEKNIEQIKYDLNKGLDAFHQHFKSKLNPRDGLFVATQEQSRNGIIERIGENEAGFITKEYFQGQNNRLIRRLEKLADGSLKQTFFDETGTAYREKINRLHDQVSEQMTDKLLPNIEIKQGNQLHKTDQLGRVILAKASDIKLRETERQALNAKLTGMRSGDDRGHLIPDMLNGGNTLENLIPQNSHQNRGSVLQFENKAKDMINGVDKIDYEVAPKYAGANDIRPYETEHRIYKNGVLQEQMIIPNFDISDKKGWVQYNAIKAHVAGKQTGYQAAMVTAAMSTVENVSDVIDGKNTVTDAVGNIVKDTGTAGALGYGTGFVSAAVANQMRESSHGLIKSLGVAGVPGAAVAMGVDSFDSTVNYAQGKIDGKQYAVELGESAVGTAGSALGASVGSVLIPVPVVGAMVGGMVGYAVATEAYNTVLDIPKPDVTAVEKKVVETGKELVVNTEKVVEKTVDVTEQAAEALKEKATKLAEHTVKLVEKYVPEKVNEVKGAINDFAAHNKIDIHF